VEYDLNQLPARPGNTAVRANLTYLEKKGEQLLHRARDALREGKDTQPEKALEVNTLHRTPDVASTPTILPDTGTATISELRF
jgi:hypothetical protein